MQSNALLPDFQITDLTLAEVSFKKVKNASGELDYEKTINLVLSTINTIKRSQLTIAYDHRVYGFIQQYKYDAAVQDIEKLIEYNPDLGTNYLKLANVLDLQGKQEKVYQVCDEALKKKKISENDSLYGQLVQLKQGANKKRTRRIDPLAVLPVKLGNRIFTALTTKDLMVLMYISSLWRQRVLQCETAWETVGDISNHRLNALCVLPQVAKHVKKMILSTEKPTVMSRYFEFIEDGVFTKIESLNLKVTEAKNMSMIITNAFWKIRNTLTNLSLDVPSCTNPVQLVDILFYCKNLKALKFKTGKGSLASALGDLELLEDSHKSLIDLRLSVPKIMTGQSLKSLIRWCPNIRRLILDNTSFPDDVIDVILNDCHHLEILGYSYKCHDNDIFFLDNLNTNDSSINDSNKSGTIIKNNHNSTTATSITPHQSNDNNSVGQLRILSTPTKYSYHTPGVPINQLIRLLQKHQKSLERIYANMAITHEQQANGEPHPYLPYIGVDVLTFDRLEHLSYVADIYGVMEKLFLNSIESSHSSLKTFEVVDSFNIPAIVDTLIKIPPVQKLNFFYRNPQAKYHTFQYYFGDEDQQQQQEDVTVEQSMVRLFTSYAFSCNNPYLSFSIGFNGDNATSVLETVSFQACTFFTDSVLDALAEIKTLKVLEFEKVDIDDKITTQGFKSFLIKLGQNTKIIKLKLYTMNNVFKKYHGDYILRLIVLRILQNDENQ
ncbi:hypothetical protein INT45_012951 [Circinella minor]|uniref:F-box domain-containing protein n=1 Tax=Circinella minor TaxID=1195481 RepID=A0A8H7S7P5_9FUNG|nr:hypothetical protein INT45_012951 [Circinella minor]